MRNSLFRGLVASLFINKRICTTEAKAKELRPIAEKYITWAKKGDLHHRRLAAQHMNSPEAVKVLFNEIGPAFHDRQGGYTRIYKLGKRRGDATDMALIELVGFMGVKADDKGEEAKVKAPRRRKTAKTDEAETVAVAE